MTDGKENQLKGLKGEQFYVNYFQKLGYKDCQQSEKKSLFDAVGIDLINIPYLIQIKSGKQKNMNPGKILTLIYTQIKSNIPLSHIVHKENYNLFVIHHKTEETYTDDIIYMSLDTFEYYVSIYGEIKYVSSNFRTGSNLSNEFNKIIGVSMEEFHNKILKK